MPEMTILERIRKSAKDQEIYEQGGGVSMVLYEAAEALDKAINMLRRLEFSVDLYERTGKDARGCPLCNGGAIVGLPGEHDEGCELAALLRELDPPYPYLDLKKTNPHKA